MSEAEVSRTLALAWGLAAAPQRGPKRELSLERIVDAAIEIADAEGLGAVTMQRVAKTFDFSTMALYRYVTTKDELHQLMLDTAMSRSLGTVAAQDWRAGFGELLRGLVSGYRAHPWALDIPLTPDIHLMPGQVRVADAGLRAMREMRAPATTKLGVLMLLSAFARGHAEVEREVLAGIEVSAQTRALLEEAVSLAEFPEVGALVRSGVYFGDGAPDAPAEAASAQPGSAEEEADAILAFATEVLVTGLDTMLESLPPQPDETPPPPRPTPQLAYELAEARLREHRNLRKQAQQRVRQLEREEAVLQKARDRAKELARAHLKLSGE